MIKGFTTLRKDTGAVHTTDRMCDNCTNCTRYPFAQWQTLSLVVYTNKRSLCSAEGRIRTLKGEISWENAKDVTRRYFGMVSLMVMTTIIVIVST